MEIKDYRSAQLYRMVLGILKKDVFGRPQAKSLKEIRRYFLKHGYEVNESSLRTWLNKMIVKDFTWGKLKKVGRCRQTLFFIDRD